MFPAEGRGIPRGCRCAIRTVADVRRIPLDVAPCRRTRIGGELRDGTGDVPLAEASEAYEVDILDGPGGSVKRTLTSTSPTVTYANADVVADFGSVPSQLSFVVYQMSAAVGRGFPGTFTVEVE